MSKDIFLADYSRCRQTSREVISNGSYLDDILGNINDGDGYITSISGVFSIDTYNGLISEIKNFIKEEKNRYSNFYKNFEEFHEPLEDIDAGLSQMLDSELENLKKNNNYDTYVAIIDSNEQSNLETSLYYSLLKEGLSKEEALKFSAIGDRETEDLIKKYAEMSPSEYEQAMKALKEKIDKSPAELILIDICSFNSAESNISLLNDVSKEFGTGGGWASVVEKGFLNKSLGQAKLDAKSLTGQINKLQREIRTSQLSQAKINAKIAECDRLKILRDDKLGKISGAESTQKNVASICKNIGRLIKAYQVLTITGDEYKRFIEGGVEFDDCVADGVLTWGGICVAGAVGSAAGEKIGAVVGTAVTPGAGTAAGIAGGLVVGGVVGVAYEGIVKPIGTFVYDNALEPAGEWLGDRGNDIGDWWDSLWW